VDCKKLVSGAFKNHAIFAKAVVVDGVHIIAPPQSTASINY